MSKDISDRRVQKTCKLLQDALVELVIEKNFEAVTIQKILDRANVGRSTFYTHFENKHELLHSCFEEFRSILEQHISRISEGRRHSDNLNVADFSLSLFELVERNHRLFKALIGGNALAIHNQHIYGHVFSFVEEALKRAASSGKRDPLQLEMLAHYLTNSFVGTLKWWVDRNMPCPAKEVDKYFKQFALFGASEILRLVDVRGLEPLTS